MEWRVIPSFPNYEVSDRGDVRRCKPPGGTGGSTTKVGKLLAPQTMKSGYVKVGLYSGGRYYNCKVHHLVLETFGGPRPEGALCRHRDGVKSHNHLGNLVWGTSSQNAQDRTRHGTYHRRLTNSVLADICAAYAAGELQKSIAARVGVSQVHISRIVRGKIRGHF